MNDSDIKPTGDSARTPAAVKAAYKHDREVLGGILAVARDQHGVEIDTKLESYKVAGTGESAWRVRDAAKGGATSDVLRAALLEAHLYAPDELASYMIEATGNDWLAKMPTDGTRSDQKRQYLTLIRKRLWDSSFGKPSSGGKAAPGRNSITSWQPERSDLALHLGSTVSEAITELRDTLEVRADRASRVDGLRGGFAQPDSTEEDRTDPELISKEVFGGAEHADDHERALASTREAFQRAGFDPNSLDR